MKANFIIPSWSYWKEPLRAQPLTQLYLATILEDNGAEVEITDFRDGPKEVNEADLYLYTIASPDLKECKELATDIRKKFPKAKHIAGGPHPSIMRENIEEFDMVACGKGEETMITLAKGSFVKNDDYSFPKRHFLPIEKIVNDGLFKTTDKIKSTTAQFSFGCPFTCSFCANYDNGTIRRNSLEKISNEIDYLKSMYDIEGLSLQDEVVIPFGKRDANEFLDLLGDKEIYWRGQIRVLKDTTILKKAKRNGLVELSFGLESVNQHVLNLTNKKIRVEDVINTVEACKKYDIKTRLYLINGLPGENKNIVKETKQFIERVNPDMILLSSLQPYPGSPIAENPEKYGIKWMSTDYTKYNHLKCRFGDDEDLDSVVPFEYEDGLSRQQIYDNNSELQEFLRGRDMNK